MLAYFKYVGFLIASVVATLDKVGLHVDIRPLEIILPIGISFFTFQAMSYVIDVFREKITPASWLDFAVYLSFFPHLVAGPIVRGAEFLPQLHPPRDPRRLDSSRAFYLIFIGLAKKIVIADFLASHIVDQVFASPGLHSGPGGPVRHLRLRHPDLRRLQRLLRHRHRPRPAARLPLPGELQRPLHRGQHHRLLAALAHDACRAGCATTSTSPWGATRAAACSPTAT